jgi:hypothetical protein
VKVTPSVTNSEWEETGGSCTVSVPPTTIPPGLETTVCPFMSVVTGSAVWGKIVITTPSMVRTVSDVTVGMAMVFVSSMIIAGPLATTVWPPGATYVLTGHKVVYVVVAMVTSTSAGVV